jgi:hypothetical protein
LRRVLKLAIGSNLNKVSSGGDGVLLGSKHCASRAEDENSNPMPRCKPAILPPPFGPGPPVVKTASGTIKIRDTDSCALSWSSIGIDDEYNHAPFVAGGCAMLGFGKSFCFTRWRNNRRHWRWRRRSLARFIRFGFGLLLCFYRRGILRRLFARIRRFLLIVGGLLFGGSLSLRFGCGRRRNRCGYTCRLFSLSLIAAWSSQHKESCRAKRKQKDNDGCRG